MKRVEVFCDYCKGKIEGDSRYPINDHLQLSAVDSPVFDHGHGKYPIGQRRKLEKPLDFCNIRCLTSWTQI